jgi:hypothetical protein
MIFIYKKKEVTYLRLQSSVSKREKLVSLLELFFWTNGLGSLGLGAIVE